MLRKEILPLALLKATWKWFVGNGEIGINKLVPLQKQALIKEAAKIHGILSHKTLIDNLPSDITYGEIRMVLTWNKKQD